MLGAMRSLVFALMLAVGLPVCAAELILELPGGRRHWSSAELLGHPQAENISIAADVGYKRSMHYRAVPLARLLEGITPGDHLQAVAADGFAAELSAAPLLATEGARAWLAIEDPAAPWPALGEGKISAGPFYLVWTHPEAANIGPEQWPFQIQRIRQLTPLAQRFPALLPSAQASADVQAGFAHYRKHCMACHRLNRQGDAQLGPDLNLPYNPTEYFREDFLRRYIRDPQALRHWPQARMPAFPTRVLSDAELEQLLAYLRHMAGRKGRE